MKKFGIILLLSLGFSHLMAQAEQADSVVSIEVNFDLDSFTLDARQKDKVDSLLLMMPFTVMERVEIYGHTDSLASVEYNRSLSKRRVQSILAYLVYMGLDATKVKADYYGEERPKYENTADERFRNRRCELYFVVDPGRLPPPEQKLTDLPFNKGDKIRIPNLNFVGNQPIPVGESFEALAGLLRVMQKYPDLKIELHGHVCCGNDHQLSVERAKMVYGFLWVMASVAVA
ncbi:MAG: OmpA family protein [Owenweeksia sp.]|nr:OmpA family protein [Owenweeksia sp.]